MVDQNRKLGSCRFNSSSSPSRFCNLVMFRCPHNNLPTISTTKFRLFLAAPTWDRTSCCLARLLVKQHLDHSSHWHLHPSHQTIFTKFARRCPGRRDKKSHGKLLFSQKDVERIVCDSLFPSSCTCTISLWQRILLWEWKSRGGTGIRRWPGRRTTS